MMLGSRFYRAINEGKSERWTHTKMTFQTCEGVRGRALPQGDTTLCPQEGGKAEIAGMPGQHSMACPDPCWSLQALGFQEEVEAWGIYLSLELGMTTRNETCRVHYSLLFCGGLLCKFSAAPCVVWRELHEFFLSTVYGIIFIYMHRRGWTSGMAATLPWLRSDLPIRANPMGRAGRNLMFLHFGEFNTSPSQAIMKWLFCEL